MEGAVCRRSCCLSPLARWYCCATGTRTLPLAFPPAVEDDPFLNKEFRGKKSLRSSGLDNFHVSVVDRWHLSREKWALGKKMGCTDGLPYCF